MVHIMRKLVVYITRVLNVKLALSFYISGLHAESVLIFLQAQTVDKNYCYNNIKRFLIKILRVSMPQDPPDCAAPR